MSDDYILFIVWLSLAGLLACCLALVIHRVLKIRKIVISLAICCLLLIVCMALLAYGPDALGLEREESYVIDQVFVDEKASVSFKRGFDIATMCEVVTYESTFRGGILRNYLYIDLDPYFPEIKDIYSNTHVVVWSYELKPERFNRAGNVARIKGREIHPGILFYCYIPKSLTNNVSRLYASLTRASLTEADKKEMEDMFIRFLDNEDADIVGMAIRNLARSKSDKPFEKIKEFVHHPNKRVRETVVTYFGVFNSTKSIAVLREMEANDSDEEVRELAGIHLERLGALP